MAEYRTTPDSTNKMPSGIPFIIGNEAAERFSFYGMKAILVVFMTKYLVDSSGALAPMGPDEAKEWYHHFTSAVYFTPILGALLSDIFLGKFRTILFLSVVYCLGHVALAVDETRMGLVIGLTLITIGAGGIKPCVSAHVGDQFGHTNRGLIEKVFGWFYFSINLGAMASMLLAEPLLENFGPHVAFGLPGLLMLIATIVFWSGRNRFIHIPPGGRQFVRDTFSPEGLRAAGKLGIVFLFIAPFWALFDQTGSAWVLQADKMELSWAGMTWLPSQIQAVNPLLILLLIPVFSLILYPAINRLFKLTPLRKIAMGLFIAGFSFVISAYIESMITGGDALRATSTSAAKGSGRLNLLDGSSEKGWTSAKAPTADAPQELLIRLRERKAWPVSMIEIEAGGELTRNEILKHLESDSLAAFRRASEEPDHAEALRAQGAALGAIESLAADADDPRLAAQDELTQRNLPVDWLDAKTYRPQKIVVYGANWQDQLLPDSFSDFAEKQKSADGEGSTSDAASMPDPMSYSEKVGWKKLGEIMSDGTLGTLDFESFEATHVLIQIHTNHGGPAVRLAEVQIFQSDRTPKVNVAAIGDRPSIAWQLLAYLILTAAEVMVSITCLEFAYTQAPARMKSFIMSLFMLSISLGNQFTAQVNRIIQKSDGTSRMDGPSYYWFFVAIMFVTALLFLLVVRFYKEQTYIHDDGASTEPVTR